MIIRTLQDITEEEKKAVAEFIQKEMNEKEFYTVDIIHNVKTGEFKVVELEKSLPYILNDYIFYNAFRNYGFKEMTVAEIEEVIFTR